MSVWFVTGASRGFGREIALAAHAAGHRVVATMRDPAAADAALTASGRALVVPLDVRDDTQIAAAVTAATDAFSTIDVLVNNAGHGLLGAIESTTAEEVREIYELNVFSLLAVTRAVLPAMREAGRGRIINIGSMGGIAAFAGTGVYASTKFAVEGITEALADELSDTGIRATVVEPGSFRTGFMDATSMRVASGPTFAAYDAAVDSMIDRHLSTNHRQVGDPARAAAAILTIAETPEPPIRVQLGRDAVARTEAKLERVATDLANWRPLSESTGFPAGA